MPVYIVSFGGCACRPTPDFALRADDMVSAVMKCHEKLHEMQNASEKLHEGHNDLMIEAISVADFELMDDEGIAEVVELWKDLEKMHED